MKREIFILLLMITSLKFALAGGVGISPVYYERFFEPSMTETFQFNVFTSSSDKGIKLFVEGDLAKYFNLSKTFLPVDGKVNVTMNLPNKIDVPGTHSVFIGAMEGRNISEEAEGAAVGGIAGVRGRINILVPYPGEYAESTFEVSNANKGENAPYELQVKSLGTNAIKVKSRIEVYRVNSSELLTSEVIPERIMQSKEGIRFNGELETKDLVPGEYEVFAVVDWGKETWHNQSLKIGEFLVDVKDYDYKFEQGKINPFNIVIENKWNTEIDEVYAIVSITDMGRVVGEFKTVSIDTDPWEVKNLTGYFDTTNLEAKKYTAKIILSFDGETTSKLVAIYVNQPATTIYRNYIIIAIAVIFIIILTYIYLILKIYKLKRQTKGK